MKLKILSLTNRYNGIAKHKGSTYELPFVLPGEIVEGTIVKTTPTALYALPKNIEKTAPERAPIDCIHFGTCASCSLRHLRYHKSVELKKEKFLEALKKSSTSWTILDQGGFMHMYTNISIQKSPKSIGYRNQCSFRRHGGKMEQKTMLQHGYFETKECYTISPSLFKKATELHTLLPEEISDFELRESTKGEILCILTSSLRPIALPSLPAESVYVYNTIEKHYHHISGADYLTQYLTVEGKELQFQMGPESFFQVNTSLSELMFTYAMRYLPSRGEVWDYFSGTGVISIIAGSTEPNLHITGIELREEMVTLAKGNAQLNHVDNITFSREDLSTKSLSSSPDILFVDPPRNGLGLHLSTELATHSPREIIYISCNPETFLKDMEILSKKYAVSSIKLFDMMPYTAHLELVAHLTVQEKHT